MAIGAAGAATLRLLSTEATPGLMLLPWDLPLEEWPEEHLVPLQRGLSRHVVRFVRVGRHTCAVKETDELVARREYHLLRDLRRLGLPTVVPQAVVTGRKDGRTGDWLESAVVTRFLRYSLPYRTLFSRGLRADSLPALVDALVVLLVRLHLAGFFWGDVSLSNALFRRSAGEFAAYLVDAETGELHEQLSRQQREHDLELGRTNVYGELLDLQAGGLLEQDIDPVDVVDRISERYDALWHALTSAAEFGADEIWRIDAWVESLNKLGFDVAEMEVVREAGDSRIRVLPRVVEAGHHSRELRALTGLDVEDAQARRLLNDIAGYGAHVGVDAEDRELMAQRWLTEIFEPLLERVPADLRHRLEPAELFHEILVHRWFLSEKAGREVDIFDTAVDYIEHVLPDVPGPESTAELRAVTE